MHPSTCSLGASINNILDAADSLDQRAVDTSHSRSRILDTDYAAAASELSRLDALASGASFALLASRKIERAQFDMIESNKGLICIHPHVQPRGQSGWPALVRILRDLASGEGYPQRDQICLCPALEQCRFLV